MGLSLRPILGSLGGALAGRLALGAVLVSLAVIVAGLVWVFPAAYFRRLSPRVQRHEPRPRWQFVTVVCWAGVRGGDSLILAAAIPTVTAAGAPFPGRDMIIAITYAVILVTLLGQGFTLAPLLRWLEVRETGEEERREETAARLRASKAALARLEELASEQWMHPETLAHTRDRYHHRARRLGAPRAGAPRATRRDPSSRGSHGARAAPRAAAPHLPSSPRRAAREERRAAPTSRRHRAARPPVRLRAPRG